jgi:phosphoribosyl 1,2-cyclic phosphodiesterase
MIRYSVLGSGSSGNSYLFSTDSCAVLIDAGFSLRELRRRSTEAGLDFSLIRGVCITHLHPDHCRGAGVFARQTGLPVHVHQESIASSQGAFSALGIPQAQVSTFIAGVPFTVGDFTITAFPTSHDSPGPVGFSLEAMGRCFTVLTDTGIVDEQMHGYINASDILFLEANYDVEMLQNGPYPLLLKRRIAGKLGHLSNTDAIELLNACLPERTRHVYFCHISKTNNSVHVIADACKSHLKWKGSTTICEHGATYAGSIDPGEPRP